jgi:uncharacterized protein
MRWKNGLGETAEIAIAPAGAALDRFDWRVSMARVEAAGPFSAFPGIDRTLTVVEGAGFRLAVGGQAAIELTRRSPPFSFEGDRSAQADLVAGPVSDLNVMTRRECYWHRVRRCAARGRVPVGDDAMTVLVFCSKGAARLRAAGAVADLGAFDTLLIERPAGPLEALNASSAELLLIEIGPR